MSKFELFQGRDGKFYFHLKSENDQIVASSAGYMEKEQAKEGIKTVKRIAANAIVEDFT